jgi:hypothetical protein
VVIGAVLGVPGRGAGRPFLTGFVIAGLLALVVVPGLALVTPWEWFIPLFRWTNEETWKLYRDYALGPRLQYKVFFDASTVAVFTALFTLPELLIALTGGLLVRMSSRPNPSGPHPSGPADAPDG